MASVITHNKGGLAKAIPPDGDFVPFPLPCVQVLEERCAGSPYARARRGRVRRLVFHVNAAIRTLNALSEGKLVLSGVGVSVSYVPILECLRRAQVGHKEGGDRVFENLGLPSSTGAMQLRLVVSLVERVRAHLARQHDARCRPSRAARQTALHGGNFCITPNFANMAIEAGASQENLDSLPFSYSLFDYSSSRGGVEVPLVAARVALPAKAGAVDMLQALPPAMAEKFVEEKEWVREGVGVGARPKTGKAPEEEQYVLLLRRMLDAGMLMFVREAEFLEGGGIQNGVFCVAKDEERDRLIINMRPNNASMVDPPYTELPGADLWTKLQVPVGEVLYVAKTDLANMYHSVATPPWVHRRSGLPSVQGELLGERGPGSGRWVPCCTTMAMGWKFSVNIGQAAHLHFILSNTLLLESDRICVGNDFRLDRPRWFQYIDDVVYFCTEAQLPRARELLSSYLEAVEASGWEIKLSKVTDFSADGVDVLGFRVYGRTGMVAPVPEKLAHLVLWSEAVCARGAASGEELRRLLGHWTWLFMLRRPAFSIFTSVFALVERAEKLGGGQVPFQLWPSVVREFSAAVAIAPLLSVCLSAVWAPEMFASDASELGVGVVSAPTVRGLCESMLSEHGRAPSTHLAKAKLWKLGLELVDLRWKVRISSRWKYSDTINRLEFRALLMSVRRALQTPGTTGKQLASLTDSAVVLGAACKGRSSSDLQPYCRQLAALLFAGDVRLVLAWISTVLNPSDKPSREFGV
jgi:hypothetical protein